MDIAEIATSEYIEVDVSERLGKVRSIFEDDNPKGVIVTRDGEYGGVLSERDLLQSHIEDHTRAEALVEPAPKVDRTEDVREVARVLVEGNTKVAPVFDAGRLWGIVTEDAILEAVLDNLDALDVADIYTEDPVTIQEEARIGEAINLLREHGISRLPVLDESGRLAGVVTIHDIVDFATRNMQRTTRGDRSGDSDRMLDIPVYDEMSSPVETTTADASVRTAVEAMLDNDYAGLVVVDEEDGGRPVGVVTKTDVLRALTFTEERHMDVQITNIDLLETTTRQHVRESIEAVADKYQDMQVQHAHVRLHEHKEKLRGTPLIQCQIRLRTDKGQIGGSGEGYGSKAAFHVALDKLERNVLERKGVVADEEYRGQLLRKLGEL
jgi:CBS domain-containing protein/ribosome-associated translation inhibitor RaiA